jgi:multiple sugar transport system substrate-binding protein
MRRHRMLLVTAAATIIATACTAGGGSGSTPTTAPNSNPSASHAPVTLTVWSAFVKPELPKFEAVLAKVHEKYPWITIQSVGGKEPTDVQRAINSGTAPDVALEPSPDDSAKYCSTGTWMDLNPLIQADGTDLAATSPPAALQYTSYKGVQCSLPMLSDAYGLYYNVDMLNAAGITSPPKTFTELQTDALKLTTYNPDGSIKVLGFNPLPAAWENPAISSGPYSGAQYYDSSGVSALGTDPKWQALYTWQKGFIDAIGYDKLTKWFQSVGGANSEFSPSNAWENGKVAMTIDGEWRVAFVKDDGATLNYATAPFPVADDNASANGCGTIGGTILGIPKGAKDPGDAWLVVKYLALDTAAEVQLATSLGNVPTTFDSLKDPSVAADPNFKVFLDIFGNANSGYKQITPVGTADADLLAAYAARYMAGNGGDLQHGLQGVADQIDKQSQLG